MEENNTQVNLDNEVNNINTENDTPQPTNIKKGNWGVYFGIFMILIYFGMAYLTLGTNYFFWIQDWARYGLGTIFVVYGLWRAYRYIKAY